MAFSFGTHYMSTRLDNLALDQLFVQAHTFNAFTDQAVSDETLHQLYDLLKWGPTAMNCQPGRYVFVRSEEAKALLLPAMSPGNVDKTRAAPVTVLIASDKRFQDQLPTQFPAYDAKPMFDQDPELAGTTAFRNGCLQGAYLIMAARALGLDCGPMGGFDADKVNAAFFPDGQWQVNFTVNLGYGKPEGHHPRGPRLSFDEAARIV